MKMEKNNLIDKCRACFKESADCVFLNDSCGSLDYREILKKYLGLSVEISAKCPKRICKKCVEQLHEIVEFVTNLRNSNKTLSQPSEASLSIFNNSKKSLEIEEDDENLPLSQLSLKEEIEVTKAEDDDCLNSDREELEKTVELDSIDNNCMRIVCEKNGVNKNMVQCLTCGLIVQSRSAFIIHYRKHTGEKPCACHFCDRRFTQTGTLADHIRKHHPDVGADSEKMKKKKEQIYICHYCGKNFTKKNYLTVHLRIHTLEKPYQCSQCPKAFRRCIDFIQHRRIHSGDRPYSCHMCARSFVSHTSLKRHLSVHSDEKKFKCNICNTAVKSNDSLKKHIMVMHTTDRPNVCTICNAMFALKYNLKAHMKARHSERSGTCSVCKKEFSNIQKHLKTHSAERMFSCLMCNRKFFTEKGLSTHSEKHSMTNAPLTCNYDNCLAAFSKQCKLEFHILKYHSDNVPHCCQLCSKGFYRLPDLRRHMKSVHPSKSEIHVDNDRAMDTLIKL